MGKLSEQLRGWFLPGIHHGTPDSLLVQVDALETRLEAAEAKLARVREWAHRKMEGEMPEGNFWTRQLLAILND